MNRSTALAAVLCSLCTVTAAPAFAGAGEEAGDFLYIPVGAKPAALGGAYSALATDANAPAWNPAGLGFVQKYGLSATYLSYLDETSHQSLNFVAPVGDRTGLGFTLQYLYPGKIKEFDATGTRIGDYSGYYGVGGVSWGYAFSPSFSLGLTGKVIQADIAGVKGNAYAGDAGALVKVSDVVSVTAVAANVGSKIEFLNEEEDLASAFKAGAAVRASPELTFAVEGVQPKSGDASVHAGADWKVIEQLSLRGGWQSHATEEVGGLAGLTAGLGLRLDSIIELDYAWVPMGDLGQTHHISLNFAFGRPR